jgi:hypothetical protein
MARCGAITLDGTKCKRRVAAGKKWCRDHPGGRSKYQPKQLKSRTRRRQPTRSSSMATAAGSASAWTSRRTTGKRRTAAQRRTERVTKRARKVARVVDAPWSDQVLAQLDAVVGEGASAGLSVSDCVALARTADRLLHGRRPRRRRGGLLGLLVRSMDHESLAAMISDGLDLPTDQSDTAAARALQTIGIALCQQAGIPLANCPCFEDPAGTELESVLLSCLRLAAGDWTGLAIPFEPLVSP